MEGKRYCLYFFTISSFVMAALHRRTRYVACKSRRRSFNSKSFAEPGAAKKSEKRGQQVGHAGVVAERFADVGVAVLISGSKNKTAAELEGILAQLVLAMAVALGALPCCSVVLAQQMEKGSLAQPRGLVSFLLVIDQQGEGDAGILAEAAGIGGVAQPNGHQPRSFLGEITLVFAQLRDVLTADNSTVVSQEHHHRRRRGPQRTQLYGLIVSVGQRDAGQLAADGFGHARHFRRASRGCQARSRQQKPNSAMLDRRSFEARSNRDRQEGICAKFREP